MIISEKLFSRLNNAELEKDDEQLLLFKIIKAYSSNDRDKHLLYKLLTGYNFNSTPKIGLEVQPLTKRNNEGNTNLDLAMGNIQQRTNTTSGIELGNSNDSFLFCEAKWSSDISYGVKYCTIRNQLQRVIETALTFSNTLNFNNHIFVTLLTPKLHKINYLDKINSRFYGYKYDEYLNNPTSIFLKEIRSNEISTKIPFKDEKYDKIVENNLKKLCLNWVTIEDLIESIPDKNLSNELKNLYNEFSK